LAKKRSSGGKVSTRPIVKQIDTHIKELRALKSAAATPQARKKADRHIKKLTKLRSLATRDCDGYFLLV